jgi:hypothetical protein
VCSSSVYEPQVDKLDKLGKYYNAINSTLVRPNVTTVVPFVLIIVPFAGRVVTLNRKTIVPFTIDVSLQVLHLWRLGIGNRR